MEASEDDRTQQQQVRTRNTKQHKNKPPRPPEKHGMRPLTNVNPFVKNPQVTETIGHHNRLKQPQHHGQTTARKIMEMETNEDPQMDLPRSVERGS